MKEKNKKKLKVIEATIKEFQIRSVENLVKLITRRDAELDPIRMATYIKGWIREMELFQRYINDPDSIASDFNKEEKFAEYYGENGRLPEKMVDMIVKHSDQTTTFAGYYRFKNRLKYES